MIDQAQHFAALGPSGAGGSTGDTAQSFREGLDGTERECEFGPFCCYVYTARVDAKPRADLYTVFALAQESAKRTKRWYDDSDRSRR